MMFYIDDLTIKKYFSLTLMDGINNFLKSPVITMLPITNKKVIDTSWKIKYQNQMYMPIKFDTSKELYGMLILLRII